MAITAIKRIPVWSSLVRLSHWLLALSTLLLLASGWLIERTPGIAEIASDWHYIVGSIFTIGLILRLWLLIFGHGSEQWKQLMPKPSDLPKIKAMLIFYITLGKAPIPKWHAHNPLWMPVYLLMFALFIALSLTGHFQESFPIVLNIYLPSLHELLSVIVASFVILHLVTVFLHDLKGTGSDTSAIINGHRIFVVESIDSAQENGVQTVSVDELVNRGKINKRG